MLFKAAQMRVQLFNGMMKRKLAEAQLGKVLLN